MSTMMEGNPVEPVAEKPIMAKDGQGFKRTFPLDHATGRVLISGPVSADEALLEQSSGEYAGVRLMRGAWKELGTRSGTFFPLAADAVTGAVTWGSAARCLLPRTKHGWRCGFGTDVLPSALPSRPSARVVLDFPSQRLGTLPDFGFMLTEAPEAPAPPLQRLFIPSPRRLQPGDPVCVLGFAEVPTAAWARVFLRTAAGYEEAVQQAEFRGRGPPPSPEAWQLDGPAALHGALDLLHDDVCFPSRLVASPGLVSTASPSAVEHTCSTFPGMSGAPGVDIQHPWQLLFVHTHADTNLHRNNHGCSVDDPLFVRAYEREVLPRLLASPPDLVSVEMLRCLQGYLEGHKGELADPSVLRRVEQRC